MTKPKPKKKKKKNDTANQTIIFDYHNGCMDISSGKKN